MTHSINIFVFFAHLRFCVDWNLCSNANNDFLIQPSSAILQSGNEIAPTTCLRSAFRMVSIFNQSKTNISRRMIAMKEREREYTKKHQMWAHLAVSFLTSRLWLVIASIFTFYCIRLYLLHLWAICSPNGICFHTFSSVLI